MSVKKRIAFSNSTQRMRIRSRHANTTNAPPRALTMLCGPKTTEQFRISTAVILYLPHCTVRIGEYRRLPSTANLYSTDVTINAHKIPTDKHLKGRSQWPRSLRRRSTAARLLRSWVRIPPGAWMFFCCGVLCVVT